MTRSALLQQDWNFKKPKGHIRKQQERHLARIRLLKRYNNHEKKEKGLSYLFVLLCG